MSSNLSMGLLVLVKILCTTIIILNDVVNCFVPKSTDTYGPYVAEWTNFRLCSGPKSINTTKVSAALVKIENSFICYMNMSYYERSKIEQVKIDVFILKKTVRTKLWTNKVKEPCTHYALAEMALKYYDIQTNCMVDKGDKYYVTNITEMTYMFFGRTFFYGQFFMRAVVLANKGNVICLEMNCIYRKN